MIDTPLGNTTKYVTDLEEGQKTRKAGRALKYRRQATAARLLPNDRVSWCLRRPNYIPGKSTGYVEVWLNNQLHKAHYSGLATCGSVWTCPICASRISEVRRLELEDAVTKSGLTPVLVTVTLQHSREDRLADLIEDLSGTLRSLKMGGWWKRFKLEWGVKAHVSSLEVTWGADNGWHPHKHWLIFLDISADQIDQDTLKEELTARYTGLLAKCGRYASDQYGIDVIIGQPAAVEVGRYISKWGLASEVTKAVVKTSKTGLSPWQLLDLAGEGDRQSGVLFVEYAKATAGRRQLVWSKGGRQALGLGEEETDEQAAAEEVKSDQPEEELVIRLDAVEWGLILKEDARLILLELAEGGGLAAVQLYLEGLWEKYRYTQRKGDNGR